MPVPQRAMDLQQTIEHVVIDPDLRGASRLRDRQMEGKGAPAEPFRRQGTGLRLKRVMPVGGADSEIEVAPVDASDFPIPADFVVAALGARETGHALEFASRFPRTVLGNCDLPGLCHVLFGGTRDVARRADLYSTDCPCPERIAPGVRAVFGSHPFAARRRVGARYRWGFPDGTGDCSPRRARGRRGDGMALEAERGRQSLRRSRRGTGARGLGIARSRSGAGSRLRPAERGSRKSSGRTRKRPVRSNASAAISRRSSRRSPSRR